MSKSELINYKAIKNEPVAWFVPYAHRGGLGTSRMFLLYAAMPRECHTVMRMPRVLFIDSYLQVALGSLNQSKGSKLNRLIIVFIWHLTLAQTSHLWTFPNKAVNVKKICLSDTKTGTKASYIKTTRAVKVQVKIWIGTDAISYHVMTSKAPSSRRKAFDAIL